MKFTIDRSKWRCGKDGVFRFGEGRTELLNKEGFMCCLGQVSIQCGASEALILGRDEPLDVPNADKVIPLLTRENECYDPEYDSVNYTNAHFAEEAMRINDDPSMDPEYRESRLIELFAKEGYELVFVGEAVHAVS